MKLFSQLLTGLDQASETKEKLDALVDYFSATSDRDRLWAIAILSNNRPKRTVNTALLRVWATELSGTPEWLFDESYKVVGDLMETIALILPNPEKKDPRTLSNWIDYIRSMKKLKEEEKKLMIFEAWKGLNYEERFIFNKLIIGGFRIVVSQKLMIQALSKFTQIEENILAHRLLGNWTPDTTSFKKLLLKKSPQDDLSKPYPFFLAFALDIEPENLGPTSDWQVERKYDGIRSQVIVREGQVFVWSKEEELLTDKFPELQILAKTLPNGTVLDGEILAFKEGRPLAVNHLKTRVARKNITRKLLENTPVILVAYDLLEDKGEDIRPEPMSRRRAGLEQLVSKCKARGILRLSEIIISASWEALKLERSRSRQFLSQGLMFKRKKSSYISGQEKGGWWEWKVDPLTINAVMIYAQKKQGPGSGLYSDFTVAVWDEDKLIPFTKVYSGLTEQELEVINNYVRKNTIERFGPVRSVVPKLVFEIAFEEINVSSRHKSGVSLRSPRINSWRRDKPVKDANTIKDLKKLLELYGH